MKTLDAWDARRFATGPGRAKLAVTLGFGIAAVGFATIVVSDRDGVADTFFGLQDLFGGAPQQAAPQAQAPSGWRAWLAPRRHRVARREHAAKAEPARFLRSIERERHARADGDAPLQLGRQSVCVRLCDGFAFPVGTYHGEQDRASHEATCRSECPGTATALYVEPSGADSMDQAVRVGTDKSYSELPYAFHYTTVLSDACTCHPHEGNRIKSLLHDFTLRRGDAVMTSTGFRVFHGAARFPYRRSDFLTLAQSGDLKKGDRATFHAIERASLRTTPNVIAQIVPAAAPAPLPKPVARDATKRLEHQASLVALPAPQAVPTVARALSGLSSSAE